MKIYRGAQTFFTPMRGKKKKTSGGCVLVRTEFMPFERCCKHQKKDVFMCQRNGNVFT